MRLAVLASGRGSNLKGILDLCACGRLEAEVALLLCNNPEAGAIQYARDHGVPVWVKSHKGIRREDFDQEMLGAIREAQAECIVLAGYMRLLSPAFIQAFAGRIINIHPAVLPSFPGEDGMQGALDYGVRLSGCTVHFVEEELDSGPVIIQAAVPVCAADTRADLQARIQAMEHRIYPQAIQWLAQGRLQRRGRQVHLLPGERSGLGSCAAQGETPWLVSPALEGF